MKRLFEMDQKDYSENGPVVRRPSARGILVRDGKVLLIRSGKYGLYMLPGGGIEEGETPEETLCREIKEETGYIVRPASIREFGSVIRRERDKLNLDGIYEAEHLYYFCEAEEKPGPTAQVAYEQEEGFTPVWEDAWTASNRNRILSQRELGPYLSMARQEARVLDILDLENRKTEQSLRNQAFLERLGVTGAGDMMEWVRDKLKNADESTFKFEINYSRFEHTRRVLGWTVRLLEAPETPTGLNREDLIIATIFHDVGRSVSSRLMDHAHAGGPLTREYLSEHGFDPQRTERICWLVEHHSDKPSMHDPDVDPELLLLMEADLLDDMGALGIVMDCMITESRNPEATFTDCCNHITRYTLRQQQHNPMASAAGKRFWNEKTRLTEEFIRSLGADICPE